MKSDDVFQVIHDAVTAQAQGLLTADDARRLEELVVSDPAARRLYVEYVRETASLRWWATAHAPQLSGGPTEDRVNLRSEDEGAAAATSLNETMVMPSVREQDARAAADDESALVLPPVPMRIAGPSPRNAMRWAMAAAILLVAGLAATFALWSRQPAAQLATSRPALVLPEVNNPVVATLTAAADARWEAETGQLPAPGGPLTSGALYLSSGAARITMNGGAEVIAHAPCRFDLESPSRVRLFEGQMTAQVLDKSAVGFTIVTPSANIVDLGTQFGVRVDAAGATETQVVRGKVEVQPAKGGETSELTAQTAVAVDAAGKAATPVKYRPAEFAHSMTAIDLADVVAGGDGTQGRREAGINANTGAVVSVPPEFREISITGDGKFHTVPAQPMVAGVFIPRGGQPEVLDPAGHTFTFPKTKGMTWYWLWAGGRIPIKDDDKGLEAFPTVIGDVDYGADGHGAVLLRTNKGVTFDLAALRAAHPGRTFTRFRTVCVNTALSVPTPGRPVSEKSELRIFVDGKLVYDRPPILWTDPPFEITVEIAPTARYLTLAATDGGDDFSLDWLTLGDPRLE